MATVSYETCPTSAPFFGFMGVTAALCFASKLYIYLYTYIHTLKSVRKIYIYMSTLACDNNYSFFLPCI